MFDIILTVLICMAMLCVVVFLWTAAVPKLLAAAFSFLLVAFCIAIGRVLLT